MTTLMRFEPFDAGDGELWLHPADVARIIKTPNRRSAGRIYFWTDGRQEYFDAKETPEALAAAVNAALEAEP